MFFHLHNLTLCETGPVAVARSRARGPAPRRVVGKCLLSVS